MNSFIPITLICLLSFAASCIFTKFLIRYLTKIHLFDIPNDRSNHKVKIPRGGGIAIIATIFIYIILGQFYHLPTIFSLPIIVAMILLVSISFFDDIKSLPSYLRFIVQIIAVSIVLYNMSETKLLFGGYLNFYLDRFITLLCVLWFINLYNFMDGIDGITCAQTIHILSSILIVQIFNNNIFSLDCYIIIFATLGFSIWNWQPAAIFLGDVGSITIGFITSIMLLNVAMDKSLYLAFMIPLYYIMDGTITIIGRLAKGEKIWIAHSQHYYQKSVKLGRSHVKTVCYIILSNLNIFLNVVIFDKYKIYAIISSIISVSLLLYILQHKTKTNNGVI